MRCKFCDGEVMYPCFNTRDMEESAVSKEWCRNALAAAGGGEYTLGVKRIDALIEQARNLPPMTAEQREAQRRSFAFGNCAIENPVITRELVDRVADDNS